MITDDDDGDDDDDDGDGDGDDDDEEEEESGSSSSPMAALCEASMRASSLCLCGATRRWAGSPTPG